MARKKTKSAMKDDIREAIDGKPDGEVESMAGHWQAEMEAADKWFADWIKDGERVERQYTDDRKGGQSSALAITTKLNLFHANITTLKAMLFDKLPKITVDRKFFDPADDVARVAALMAQRVLEQDCYDPGDKYADTLKLSLGDRLLPGFGNARVQYRMVEELRKTPAILDAEGKELAPAVEEPYKSAENVDIVYTHWKDIRWSPCRTSNERRWKAYRSYMTRGELKRRFPEHGAKVPLTTAGPSLRGEEDQTGNEYAAENSQAEVWEIWNKPNKTVYYWTKGYDHILDEQEDPCGFEDFYPDSKDMIANITSSKYIPKPDFMIAQDLYYEIDELETRISMLTRAAKVVGVYDKSNKGIDRLLNEAVDNQLIPVDNWAMFAQSGGLKGVMDFLPLKDIVDGINILTAKQGEKIQQLYQVTGMSDIMRGQAATTGVTATEQKIKAQFGSVRINALKKDFAEFASTLLTKKLYLIQKLYEPERIVQLSNMATSPDAALIPKAIELLKDVDNFALRVSVDAEDMAQINYEQQQGDRVAYLQGVAQFIGQSREVAAESPESVPYLLQLMQWGLAGFKGAKEVEGILDQWVAAAQQAAKQPKPPDPEIQKAQMEQQGKMQEMQGKHQLEVQKMQMEGQAEMQKLAQEMRFEQQKMQMEMQQDREKHQLEMAKLQMELQAKAAELQMKAQEIQLDTQARATEISMEQDAAEAQGARDERMADSEESREERRFEREDKFANADHKRKVAEAKAKPKASPKK